MIADRTYTVEDVISLEMSSNVASDSGRYIYNHFPGVALAFSIVCRLPMDSTNQHSNNSFAVISLLALLVVVDFRVPEQSLRAVSTCPRQPERSPIADPSPYLLPWLQTDSMTYRETQTNLITITPEEVLRPDILVRVLGLLLERRSVGHVLPVLDPQAVCVDGCNAQAGNHNVDGHLAPGVCA